MIGAGRGGGSGRGGLAPGSKLRAVLPLAPVRQWTLSPPFELCFRLGMDHRLAGRVLAVVKRAILGFQRSRARRTRAAAAA